MMFSKKKTNTLTSPDKINPKLNVRNKHQKQHSRGYSRDDPLFDINSLILKHFRQSSKQINQHQQISNINSLLSNMNGNIDCRSNFAISTKQVTLYYCTKELVCKYYMFSKNQQTHRSNPTIQIKLVQSIRKRISKQINRPFPHFQTNIYPILKRYIYKKKRLIRKQQYQGEIQGHENQKAIIKQLPTAFSQYSQIAKQSLPALPQRVCRSQSFELKALTECIKQMFSKQNQEKSLLGVTINYDNSQFAPFQNQTKRQFTECDFSSIEANSRFDLHLQSKDKIIEGPTSIQSNYGLEELKNKYDNTKLSQISLNEEFVKPLGHKRNPTDLVSQKKSDFYGNPLTPKDQVARSQFGSSSNIPIALPKKKTNKSKQKELYEPYMLKFDKKNTDKKQAELRRPFKQNLKTQRKKSKKDQIRSKSKTSKKSIIEPFKKRMQTQF